MPLTCAACGESMPEISSFCPGCGRTVRRPETTMPDAAREPGAEVHKQLPPMQSRILAAVAYATFVPALVFLLVPRFKRDRYIRFHAVQSLILTAAVVGVAILLRLLSLLLELLPGFGLLFTLLLAAIVAIGIGLLWVVLLIKALQGEWFQVGKIGQLAERVASPVMARTSLH